VRTKRERRRGCQRLDRIGRRGKKTPTLVTRSCEAEGTRHRVFDVDPLKRFGRRETSDPPVMPCGALDSVGRPRGENRGASRKRARCGYTQIVRVADVGWTHRASSAPGGRKASWSERALARRKPVAPYDAGHGWREGESVRVRMVAFQVPMNAACGFRLAGSRYDGRRSRVTGRQAFTGKAIRDPRLVGRTS